MKHAYLILAHNEFGILERLLKSLDDSRNDIYIHYDAKVSDLPKIEIDKARLIVLSDRVDVSWGDYSVFEAELNLFKEAAKNGPYQYYHLLSGVDMPLKSQNYLHEFFDKNADKEFIGYYQGNISEEINRKVQKYHLFPSSFREHTGLNLVKKISRSLFLKGQELLGVRRNKDINFKKGTQWISITDGLVKLILSKKSEIEKTYHNTFCCDEIVVQTICWNSEFKDNIFDVKDEGRGCMREIRWENNVIRDWTDADFAYLMNSDKLFARKFNSKSISVVDKILQHIQLNKT